MKKIPVILCALLGSSYLALANKHDVFVCHRDDKSISNGIYLFAHDKMGAVTHGKKPGYCELRVDAQGHASGAYSCWVEDTRTALTTDGQLAILFKKHLGGWVYVYRQLNLPKNFAEVKRGTGKIRSLRRPPKVLEQPLSQEVENFTCAEETVDFRDF